MTTITTYNTLVQAVKDEAEDDGTEFAAFIPYAVDLAEERLFRELDLPELETEKQGTLTENVQTLTKPTGYEFCQYFSVGTSFFKRILKKKTKDFILDYWQNPSEVDFPKYYCDESAANFLLAPTPDTNYAYQIRYTTKPTKLGASTPTNYYIDNCKDLLFAAVMWEMCHFMKAFGQLPVWESRYVALRDGWNLQQVRYRRDGGTSTRNTDSSPNTLKHAIQTTA